MTIYGEDLIPTMTGNTAPLGTASASSVYGVGYEAYRALNDNYAQLDDWSTAVTAAPWWLKYDFGAGRAFVASRYTMRTRNYTSSWAPPKTWKLQGSNDDSTWTDLDSRTSVTDWASSADSTKTFTFENGTAYRYYRLYITASNGDGTWVALGGWELLQAVRADLPTSGLVFATSHENVDRMGNVGVSQTSWLDLVAGASSTFSGTAPAWGTNGLSFAGASWVHWGDSSAVNLGSGARTIGAWVNLTSLTGAQIILGKMNYGGAYTGWSLYWTGSAFRFDMNGSLGSRYCYGGSAAAGVWHYVSATYNGTDVDLYLDGALLTTTKSGPTGANNVDATANLYAGAMQSGSTSYMNGRIGALHVWNTALSAGDIQTAFRAGLDAQPCDTYGLAGGIVTSDGAARVHRFTASGRLMNYGSDINTASALVVGGGGSGGSYCAAGGGGGGVIAASNVLCAGATAVTVGAGGTQVTTTAGGNDGQASAVGGTGTNATPTMTSNTAPTGVASASSIYSSTYDAFCAFNHANGTSGAFVSWVSQSNISTGWLQYQFPTAKFIGGYAITARFSSDGAQNAPNTWTLKGSNDGSSWTTLDSRSGVTWAIGQRRIYPLTPTAAYAYYRLDITQNNGAAYCGVDELELFEGALVAFGGGGGGAYPAATYPGRAGGSGGGAAYGGTVVGRGVSGQGQDGGTGNGQSAGGGGGAAAAGGNASDNNTAGAGGAGTSSSISGTATYYAGGGGGFGVVTYGAGGQGGGGRGATNNSNNATAGAANTGGGGGGGWYAPNSAYGGAGGSGIVILRYAPPSASTATLTVSARHRTWGLTRLNVTSRHRTFPLAFWRLSLTARHLVGYVYTPPPARLGLRGRHRVLGVPGAVRLSLPSRHRIAGLVRLSLASSHTVRDVDPATLTLTSQHRVGVAARLGLTGQHKVARRSHIIPGSDPPIEVVDDLDALCQLNGIYLDLIELELGGEPLVYEKYEHYDGSIVMHNPRSDLYEHRMRIKLKGTSPSDLDTQEQAIQAACRAGGTFVWQSVGPGGVVGTLRSWSIAPSDAPSFERTKVTETLYRSQAPMVLRVWPA